MELAAARARAPETEGATIPRRRSRFTLALVLAATVVALYARTLTFQFVWDDAFQIADNAAVREGAPLTAYFLDRDTTSSREDYNTRIYRPLRNLTFRGIAVAFGVHPLPFRAAVLALYALGTALVFALALRLGGGAEAAFFATALWAALPVHVEAAAYPSALGDVLSLALQLASLHLAITAVRDGRRPWAGIAGATLLLVGAVLAKEMALTAAAVVAWLVLRLGWDRRRGAIAAAAMAIATLAWLWLRTSVIGRVGQEDLSAAIVARGLATAPVALVHYVGLMLLPLGHRLSYVAPAPSLALTAACVAVFCIVTFGAFRVDRRWGTAASSLGLGWIVVVLAPVLHLVPVWVFMADRFALAPSVGIVFVAMAVYAAGARRNAKLTRLAAATIVLGYAACTLVEQEKWRSDPALYAHDVAVEPGSFISQSNYCTSMLEAGRPDRALRACEEAERLGLDTASVHLRKATALEALNRLAEASVAIDRALALEPSAAAHAMRGNLRLKLGDRPAAEAALAQARALSPHNPSVSLLDAELGLATRDVRRTMAAYDRLIAQQPSSPRLRYGAARAAAALGERARAESEARACVALDPRNAACAELLRGAAAER